MSAAMKRGTIYFLKAERSKRIKIGFTTGDPADRLKSLQTGSPERLEVVASAPGSMADEGALHDQYESANVCGEWFDPVDDLDGFIRGILWAQQQEAEAARIIAKEAYDKEREAQAKRDWWANKRAKEAAEAAKTPEQRAEDVRRMHAAADLLLAAACGKSNDPFTTDDVARLPVRRRI